MKARKMMNEEKPKLKIKKNNTMGIYYVIEII